MHSFLIFLCADGFVSVCVNLGFVSIFRASVRGVSDLVRSGLLCVLLSGVRLVEDAFLLSMRSTIEIIRDDGSSLGKYKVPRGGKPVSAVLDSILKEYGLHGIVLEDDSTRLTEGDLLTVGHTYKFRPSINVRPPGLRNDLHFQRSFCAGRGSAL